MSMSPEISAALVEAQRSAQAVEKLNTNEHHRYKYASAESMILEARAALAPAGLALLTLGWTFAALAAGEAIGRVEIAYRLLHTSGAFHDWTASTFVVPGKGRPVDKAESGAITENLSYTLRGLLLLPRVDEGTSVETRPEPEQTTPQRGAGGPDPVVDALKARAVAAADDGGLNDVLDDGRLVLLCIEDQQDVLAEVACRGFDLAQQLPDVDGWVGAIKQWALKGEPKLRAAAAYMRATERLGA